MKERPILFSAPMVRALLERTKTQTRRVVKPQPPDDPQHRSVDTPDAFVAEGEHTWWAGNYTQGIYHSARCPYGRPGDRLWVRETHAPQADCWGAWERAARGAGGEPPILHFAADFRPFQNDRGQMVYKPFIEKWRPAIHMPRWASRIDLEVTSVHVERLQDISEADAIAEGITGPHNVGYPAYRVPDDSKPRYSRASAAYAALWDQINGPSSWDANPWVWVVEFKVATAICATALAKAREGGAA